MAGTLFCRFNSTSSLEAKGDKLRFFTGRGMGMGQVDNYEFHVPLVVIEVVFIEENIVHAMTTNGVYEINGTIRGLTVLKLGDKL